MSSSGEYWQGLKLAIEQALAIRTHPLLHDRGVHTAKVDGVKHIAFVVQCGQAGRLAIMTAIEPVSYTHLTLPTILRV